MATKPTLTPEQLQQQTNSQFKKYLVEKFKSMDSESPFPILGPTLDAGTYYWRTGMTAKEEAALGLISANQQDGWGLNKENLGKNIEILKAKGFPTPSLEELQRINTLVYEAITTALPNRKFVAKHFPGGTELNETTEKESVHYGKDQPIAKWIDGFAPALSGKQSWGMMLGHASYDLSESTFPGMKFPLTPPAISGGLYEAMKKATGRGDGASVQEVFSYVPASMNPFITDYLKTNKGYKGVLVGDWYNMGSIEKFSAAVAENWHPVGISAQPSGTDVSFIMAVNAGIEYIRPINKDVMNKNFWVKWAEKGSDGQYLNPDFVTFNKKLNQNILGTYNKLKTKGDPTITMADLDKISIYAKMDLVANEHVGGNAGALVAKGENKPKQLASKVKESKTDFVSQANEVGVLKTKATALFRVMNEDTQLTQNDLGQRGAPLLMQLRAFENSIKANRVLPNDQRMSLSGQDQFGVIRNIMNALTPSFASNPNDPQPPSFASRPNYPRLNSMTASAASSQQTLKNPAPTL